MHRSRKTCLAALCLSLLMAGACFAWPTVVDSLANFLNHRVPSPAHSPLPGNTAESMRQDLDHVGALLDVNRSFSPQARVQFESDRTRMLRKAGSLSMPQFEMGIMRLAALAKNSHTGVKYISSHLNRMPLRFAWFDEGLYVVKTADAQTSILLGARVLKIDGETPETLLQRLREYHGGTDEIIKSDSDFFLESPDALSVLIPGAGRNDASLTLEMADASVQTVTVSAKASVGGLSTESKYRNQLHPVISDGGAWRSLLPLAGNLPLVLQAPEQSVFSHPMGNGASLYLHLWRMTDDAHTPISVRLAGILGSRRRWANIVLDLRFNGGGDYTKVHSFIKRLPNHLGASGKLYIVTNNCAFSAAIVTAAWAKFYAGPHAVIVGEKIDDRLQFWTEGRDFSLPNSGLIISNATGYLDWEHGCNDQTRCFFPNFYFDVPAGSLVPSEELHWRFSDYRRGHDTVLDKIEHMLEKDVYGE